MTRAHIFGLAAFFAAGLAAAPSWAQATRPDPVDRTQDPVVAPSDDVEMDFSNLTDAQFVQKAATAGLMEVMLSKIADGEVPTEAVQEFAEQLIEDHNAVNEKLVALAEAKGIDYENTLDEANKTKYDRFNEMEGAALESAYLDEQLKAHKEAVALYSAMAEDADDADLRAFGAEALPTLKAHLQKVKALTGEDTDVEPASTTTTRRPK